MLDASRAKAAAHSTRAGLEDRRHEMVDLLMRFVEIESASDDTAGLDRMAECLTEVFAPFGTIVRHESEPRGPSHLVLTVPGAANDLPPLAVLGHYDTVWPAGTLARMPISLDDDVRLSGPGCFDMKGGLVLLYFALRELREQAQAPRRPLRILFSCDEEIQSRTARPLIDQLAAESAAALVLEAPLPGGALKTARKGSAVYGVNVTGRAAHAGIEPERGANAIVELSRQILTLQALNDPHRGTTVNVGVVTGGTRPNVVAAQARARVNVRTTSTSEAERVHRVISRLEPSTRGTRVETIADLSRPPMEATPASRALFEFAQLIAPAAGIPQLGEGSTGGVSDANLIAAQGVPTLDGLGPEGGGAHADDEHVLVESLPTRAALLAGLLAGI